MLEGFAEDLPPARKGQVGCSNAGIAGFYRLRADFSFVDLTIGMVKREPLSRCWHAAGPRTWVDESGPMTGHAPWVGIDVGRCGWSANLGRYSTSPSAGFGQAESAGSGSSTARSWVR